MVKNFDVIIIGAGVSGIGMACQLEREIENANYAVLERRSAIGGTWDLFNYPGIRSDSDMLTFGFDFRPWNGDKILADGPSIKQYLIDTAKEYNVDEKIIYESKVTTAKWSTEDAVWEISVDNLKTVEKIVYTCNFLIAASGYYNHDSGYLPEFKGYDSFKGTLVHPQHWPKDLNYDGKKVVVIGSGATAITIVPSMADKTSHITMLQRSPTYVYSVPSVDKLAVRLRTFLSEKTVYKIARSRNVLLQRLIFKLSKKYPKRIQKFLISKIKKQLGPDYDMQHFTPNYNPWDQRLAAVPDNDLFEAIKSGKASVVTDHINSFTEKGILLKSGKHLDADIIITATGLKLQVLGGMELHVDGNPFQLNKKMTYKSVLAQDTPNFAYLFGYTNASWTLKINIAGNYVARLLNELKARNARIVIPRTSSTSNPEESVLDSLNSGYVKRGSKLLPRQGKQLPWRVLHDYKQDKKILQKPIEDQSLEWIP